MKIMPDLESILEKYYEANQLSKSMNVLDIIKPDIAGSLIRPTKCVCEIFVPKDGWGRNVEKAAVDQNRCFYCKQEIKKRFPDFNGTTNVLCTPMPEEANCIYCYQFLGKMFRSGEGIVVLKKGGTKKGGKNA